MAVLRLITHLLMRKSKKKLLNPFFAGMYQKSHTKFDGICLALHFDGKCPLEEGWRAKVDDILYSLVKIEWKQATAAQKSEVTPDNLLDYPQPWEVQLRGLHCNARSLVRVRGRK